VGESRITRYGRTDFDFRPGDSLDETWTVFVLGTGVTADRTTAAVSQAEQMLSSECFRRSNGEMGCTSCHDPHSIPRPEERIQFFRSRCLQCHDSRAAECALPRERRVEVTIEDSCIDCHMPRISANDVPHTSQTDHRVLLDPTASGSAAVETTAPELTVFRGERQPLSAAELDRAWGITMMRDAERRSDRILAYHAIPKLRSWCNKAPDDAPACEALGLAYWLNRDPGSAQAVWERALEYHPREEQLLKRLVEILHENGRFTEGIEYSRQLIALNPWQHEYHGRLAHMLGQQRRFDEAIAAAEMALRINPTAASVHAWLAEVYALRGDAVRSQWHQQQYELLTPVR
jgi:predicted CXXCH cytochrome family protein